MGRLRARAIDNALQLQEEADVKCEELVKQLTASEKRSNYLVAKVRALADDLNDEKIAEEAQGIYAEQPYYNVYGLSGVQEPQATQPREPEFGLDLAGFSALPGYQGLRMPTTAPISGPRPCCE